MEEEVRLVVGGVGLVVVAAAPRAAVVPLVVAAAAVDSPLVVVVVVSPLGDVHTNDHVVMTSPGTRKTTPENHLADGHPAENIVRLRARLRLLVDWLTAVDKRREHRAPDGTSNCHNILSILLASNR